MRIILAIIFAVIGFACIDYNMEHTVKHNLLLGTIGYILVTIIPLALILPML